MSDAVKPCRKCGAQDRYGRGPCRPCHKERHRKHREANPEKVAEQKREYYQGNRDRIAEQKREYYEANREKVAERNRKHYEANREKELEYQRKYREANREKIAERDRKWHKANPEKRKAHHHNRKAKIKGNGGKLSSDIVQKIMILQKGKCACCGASLENGYHLDHVMPLALGGTNTDDNVQLLTPKCNMSKGAKHPVDYMRSKGKLI